MNEILNNYYVVDVKTKLTHFVRSSYQGEYYRGCDGDRRAKVVSLVEIDKPDAVTCLGCVRWLVENAHV